MAGNPDKPAGAHFCPQCMDKIGSDPRRCPQCKLPRPPSGWPRDPAVGRLVQQKYRLEQRLGAGGFAVVYSAQQLQGEIDLGQVALKFLRPHMAENASVRRRFVNEARAARKVGSPHAVKVFDLGFDEDGVPFMVMEHLRGKSLEQEVVEHGALQPARVVDIGLQVAGALAECHKLGIIHRDLKPDNLILLQGEEQDFVKVLDFGIARVPSADGSTTHTLMGTPRYMPPEQIMQREMDGGVDIFALGVILYECLAGQPPIPAATPMEYLQLNINNTPRPLREVKPGLPADLESLLGRMMAKERDDRPTSMGDVAMRLRAIQRSAGWGAHQASTSGEGTVPDLSRADHGRAAEARQDAYAETLAGDPAAGPSTEVVQSSLDPGRRSRRVVLAALALLGLGALALGVARYRSGPTDVSSHPPKDAPAASRQASAPVPLPARPAPLPRRATSPDAGTAPAAVTAPSPPDASPRAVRARKRTPRPRPRRPRRGKKASRPVAVKHPPAPAAGQPKPSPQAPARVKGL